MHIYMATRGIKNEVDQFITELQGKYLPFKFREKEGDPLQDTYVQLSVRPIQLWEIVFPEDAYDIVANTLFEGHPEPQHAKHKKYFEILRLALGVKKMKPVVDKTKKMPVRRLGIETVGIGMKEDYWVKPDGKHVDKKEEDAFEGL